MKFAVVLVGTTTPIRLNDRARTILVFESEIRANKICKRLNVESTQNMRLRKYEVLRMRDGNDDR